MTFNVLLHGKELSDRDIQIGLQAFASFFGNLTNKHHKRVSLTCISKDSQKTADYFQNLHLNSKINSLEIGDILEIEEAFLNASIVLVPSKNLKEDVIQAALAHGLPIITFESVTTKRFLDSSCGVFMEYDENENMAEILAKRLQMIYFDPDARTLLAKGANNKFNTLYALVAA